MEQPLVVPAPAAAAGPIGANWGVRAAARVIDLILLYVTALIAGLMAGILLGVVSVIRGVPPNAYTDKLQANVFVWLAGVIAYLVYFTLCEGLAGTTLGKRVLGLHVLRPDGTPCSPGSAFLRTLGFYVDGLFFGLIAASRMNKSSLRQRYGDVWANTMVLHRSSLPGHAWPSGLRTAAVIIGAVIAYGFCTFLAITLIGVL